MTRDSVHVILSNEDYANGKPVHRVTDITISVSDGSYRTGKYYGDLQARVEQK